MPSCHNNTWKDKNNNDNNDNNKIKNIKRQIEEPDKEDEVEYNNNVNEKNIPATIQNNNEEEEEEEDDDDDNDNDDDNNNDNSPRRLLPNCTDNDLDVPSREKTHIGNGIDEEVATLQANENLVSPTNLNSSHCNDNHKYDYHKYDMDLPR